MTTPQGPNDRPLPFPVAARPAVRSVEPPSTPLDEQGRSFPIVGHGRTPIVTISPEIPRHRTEDPHGRVGIPAGVGQSKRNAPSPSTFLAKHAEGASFEGPALEDARRFIREAGAVFEERAASVREAAFKPASSPPPQRVSISIPMLERIPPFVAPRSPHALLQEEVADDPFMVLVVSTLVARARASLVDRILPDFRVALARMSSGEDARGDALEETLRPLGLSRVRADRLSELRWAWEGALRGALAADPSFRPIAFRAPAAFVAKIPGVGPYALRCYEIFCLGILGEEPPADARLASYHAWARENLDSYLAGAEAVAADGRWSEAVDPEMETCPEEPSCYGECPSFGGGDGESRMIAGSGGGGRDGAS